MIQFMHDRNPLIMLGIETWHLVIALGAGLGIFGLVIFVRRSFLLGTAIVTYAGFGFAAGFAIEERNTLSGAWIGELFLSCIAVLLVALALFEELIPGLRKAFYCSALLLVASLHATIVFGGFVRDLAGYNDKTARTVFAIEDIWWAADFVLVCSTILSGGIVMIDRQRKKRHRPGRHRSGTVTNPDRTQRS